MCEHVRVVAAQDRDYTGLHWDYTGLHWVTLVYTGLSIPSDQTVNPSIPTVLKW